jgi:hypothetical protein
MALKSMKQNETLNAYAAVLRIPPEVYKPIVAHFHMCKQVNGSEWTVNRFKSVKQDFINLKAGLHCQSLWISRNGDRFNGSFKGLQTWTEKNWKNWSKAIQLLQIYSTEISGSVTVNQSKKFVDAVTFQPKSEQCNISQYSDMLYQATRQWFKSPGFYPDPEPLLTYPVSSTRREPHANGKSYPEGERTLDCAYSFLDQTSSGKGFVRKYPNLFKPLLVGIEDTDLWSIGSMYWATNVGKIGLIQEPGFKLRAVANPARAYQAVLKPLGDALYSKLAMLPWDCTHDQYRPFTIIQKALSNLSTVHAIDLSNATDRFPLSLQMVVLDTLFHRKDAINLFADLSRAKWLCPLTEKTISWSVGQPLGLYPSFAAFSLTHGMMLYALNDMKHNDDFFVLGDDVVILDDDLAARYKRFLVDMEVPYSPSKTLSSNVITEFAGKLITKDEVIPQLKWRHVSDDSFIDLAKHFGEPFRKLLRRRQRRIFDIVKSIPDFLGGCGFNPAGVPLKERVRMYLELESPDNRQSYLMSYNGRLQSMNYSVSCHNNKNTWIYSENPVVEFDQNSAQFARKHLTSKLMKHFPIREDEELWKHVVGNPLYVVYPRERCLPIAGTSVRTTTLDVLERKFGSNPYLIESIKDC